MSSKSKVMATASLVLFSCVFGAPSVQADQNAELDRILDNALHTPARTTPVQSDMSPMNSQSYMPPADDVAAQAAPNRESERTAEQPAQPSGPLQASPTQRTAEEPQPEYTPPQTTTPEDTARDVDVHPFTESRQSTGSSDNYHQSNPPLVQPTHPAYQPPNRRPLTAHQPSAVPTLPIVRKLPPKQMAPVTTADKPAAKQPAATSVGERKMAHSIPTAVGENSAMPKRWTPHKIAEAAVHQSFTPAGRARTSEYGTMPPLAPNVVKASAEVAPPCAPSFMNP